MVQVFTGELEHWNYDTFRAKWRDPMQDRGFISFTINRKGEAHVLDIQGIGKFTSVREKKPKPVK